MNKLHDALRGAGHTPALPLVPLPQALVVGAGGVLGSALLAEALVAGRFQRVAAVTHGALASTLRGLQPLPLERLGGGDAAGCDLAFLVFERERHSNGRDDAFLRPEPAQLLHWASTLRSAGVRRLIVVVPHAPALLPNALKAGFASHDERAVAALAFEHLVFVRAAQSSGSSRGGSLLQRLAESWMAQLRWMIPQREQPVRAATLAQLVVRVGRQLGAAPTGTRVLPPELLWQAAQGEAGALALDAWLAAPRP